MSKLRNALALLAVTVAKDFVHQPKQYLALLEALSERRYHDALGPALRILFNVGVRWTLMVISLFRKGNL